MKVIELQGIDNVRDLGGIPVSGGRVVAPGLFFRGSALYGITDDDCDVLFNQLGITCVVDVRTGWERAEKPDAEIPGVDNLHIPFYDLEKVGIEYTEPADGTKLVGRDVACEPSNFYRSMPNPLTARQMQQGLHEIFARAEQGKPVYEHCSGGKDRAGIMALLILTVLGANRDDILEDYLFTNVARGKHYDELFQRFLRMSQGDENRADELVFSHRALPENLDIFYQVIEESYGGMDAFIRNQLDISDERRAELRAACTVER